MRYLKKKNEQSKKSRRVLLFIVMAVMGGLMMTNPGFANPEMVMEPESGVLEFLGLKKNKKKKDAFTCKTKKRPNIYSSNPPGTKSRSKLYTHSISRKKVKNDNQTVFSATKSRYNLFGKKKSDKKSDKSIFGGRKSKKQAK
jgi:hypothetical protein